MSQNEANSLKVILESSRRAAMCLIFRSIDWFYYFADSNKEVLEGKKQIERIQNYCLKVGAPYSTAFGLLSSYSKTEPDQMEKAFEEAKYMILNYPYQQDDVFVDTEIFVDYYERLLDEAPEIRNQIIIAAQDGIDQFLANHQ